MDLHPVQHLLERIYGVAIAHQVGDFLVTDRAVARALDTSADARECDEKLLVCQGEDDLALSLYIDATVLERLRADDPLASLHEANLGDFLTALEGVSHFLYLLHRAGQAREVTLLELELQAEVDKYVSISTVLRTQGAAAAPRAMRAHLFERAEFDARLGDDERERYADANALAGRYCEHLESRFLSARPRAEYFEELRSFYRMSQPDKLRHIAGAQR